MDQRRPHDHDRGEVGRTGDQRGEALDHRVEQRVLEQQVVDGVPAERELGEDGDRDAVVVAGADLLQDRARVDRGVGHRHRHRARRHAGEALVVGRGEVHVPSLGR